MLSGTGCGRETGAETGAGIDGDIETGAGIDGDIDAGGIECGAECGCGIDDSACGTAAATTGFVGGRTGAAYGAT